MAVERPERPPWIGPPTREIGVPVSLAAVLLEGEDVHVALVGALLHPCGVAIAIETLWRDSDHAARAVEEPLYLDAADGLRFGVELVGWRGQLTGTEARQRPAPSRPVLLARGGLGFPGRCSLWLWPLPSDAFVLHAAWPSYGLSGSARIDAFAWPACAGDVLVPG